MSFSAIIFYEFNLCLYVELTDTNSDKPFYLDAEDRLITLVLDAGLLF